ncbi:MAG TPA: tetratricopeptide repeat protein [Chitinispirillaceae bacterium]|nr:tetratricopeptide repeat protein [Chitinispirillaceae bacterium]
MSLNDETFKEEYEHALRLMRDGQFEKAETILEYLLNSWTHSVPLHLTLGDCARKAGRMHHAGEWYKSVLELDPDNFAAHCNYGSVMLVEKQFITAEEHFREAIRINPGKKQLFASLGTAIFEQKRFSEAAKYFREAQAGGSYDIHNGIALLRALLMGGESDPATKLIDTLSVQFPGSPQLYNAIGNAYREYGDQTLARDFYVKALQLQPDYAEAHYNLGCILRQWNLLDDALSCFKNAVKFDPQNVAMLVDCGETLQIMGLCDEAERVFKNALSIDATCAMAWDNLLVSMLYNPHYSSEQVRSAHEEWGRTILFRQSGSRKHSPRKDDPIIRIGYVSSDFCKHPAAPILEQIVKLHDRTRFAVYCYAQIRHDDEKTAMFRKCCDQWREITSLSDNDASGLIANDQIDILVDCAGHMAGNRLGIFAQKPAPIQISGFGYPAATGLLSIDYYITDAICEPVDLQQGCTGKLLRMDNGFFTWIPPEDAPDVVPLPLLKKNYVTFGSLHTTARLNRDVISLWAELLKNCENSRMILFRTTLTESIIQRCSQWFEEDGVERNRITFSNTLPSGHYLTIYDEIDLSLDTFPWSGHITACESLWMGVPAITFKGDSHASSMVASLMNRIGLGALAADSRDGVVDIARSVIDKPEYLQELRKTMRQRLLKSSVCAHEKWVRELEQKYFLLDSQI